MQTSSLDTAKIAETAYQIWQESGQPHGQDQEHWFAAIQRLTATPAATAETAAPAPKKKAPARKKAAPKARKTAAKAK